MLVIIRHSSQASHTVDFGLNQPIVRISVDFSIFDIVYWRESYIYVLL